MPTSPYFSGINLVKPLEQKVTELNAHTDQTVQTFYENILKRENFLNDIHVYNMYREIHVHVYPYMYGTCIPIHVHALKKKVQK